MLFPKFSLKLMLIVTTASAIFFLIVNFAIARHEWAIGLSIGIASIPVFFMAHALGFLFAYFLTRASKLAQPRTDPESPFTTERLPPQIIPPSDVNVVE